jgi:hypothetical protein
MTTPIVGQLVKYRTSETRTAIGIITLVTSATRVSFTAVADTAEDWPVTNIPTTIHPAHLYENVDKGADVGQWSECETPGPLADAIQNAISAGIATGIAATLAPGGAVQLAIAAAIAAIP